MKKHSFGSLLFIGLVLIIMYLPIAVVVVYSFNANTARIPIDFTAGPPIGTPSSLRAGAALAMRCC